MSPTQRTLAHLKKLGIPAQVVEKWIPQVKRRKDLFGFIDIVALTPLGIVGIQVTSGDHVAERCNKIRDEPLAITWLKAGGKRKLWNLRIVRGVLWTGIQDAIEFEEVTDT